jgi:hypothetical protein
MGGMKQGVPSRRVASLSEKWPQKVAIATIYLNQILNSLT